MCEPLGAHTKTKDYNLHWIIYQPVISHKHLYWFCRLFLWCNLPTSVSSVLVTEVFVGTQTCSSFWMRKKMMHVPAQIYETRKKKDFPGKTRLNWTSWMWLEANTRTIHAASLGLNKSHEYRVLLKAANCYWVFPPKMWNHLEPNGLTSQFSLALTC